MPTAAESGRKPSTDSITRSPKEVALSGVEYSHGLAIYFLTGIRRPPSLYDAPQS